jgi:membrane-associated phospholipid phosphatase
LSIARRRPAPTSIFTAPRSRTGPPTSSTRFGQPQSLCAAGLAAAFRGWRPAEPGRIAIAASLAILVSFEIKEQLKHLFGRTWPETWTDDNPSWIRDHAYGLHPLHGGGGWESFPSGHTTQIAALAAVAWLGLPRLRWLGVALVAFGLWGSDYHFVGDILAGAFVGVAYGAGMVALLCPK